MKGSFITIFNIFQNEVYITKSNYWAGSLIEKCNETRVKNAVWFLGCLLFCKWSI